MGDCLMHGYWSRPRKTRRCCAALEPEEPHRVQEYRQGPDLMIDSCRQRTLLIPGGGRGEQRPKPGRGDNADGVDAKGEDENVLANDPNRLARKRDEEGKR